MRFLLCGSVHNAFPGAAGPLRGGNPVDQVWRANVSTTFFSWRGNDPTDQVWRILSLWHRRLPLLEKDTSDKVCGILPRGPEQRSPVDQVWRATGNPEPCRACAKLCVCGRMRSVKPDRPSSLQPNRGKPLSAVLVSIRFGVWRLADEPCELVIGSCSWFGKDAWGNHELNELAFGGVQA